MKVWIGCPRTLQTVLNCMYDDVDVFVLVWFSFDFTLIYNFKKSNKKIVFFQPPPFFFFCFFLIHQFIHLT